MWRKITLETILATINCFYSDFPATGVGQLVSTGQPRLELKWYHLNIFHSCLGWPRSGGNIYTYIGVITPDITSSFVTHYFHSREYVKLNNGVGRNILACFNPFYLPLQFVPFETQMLVRLDRFSSDVGVTLHHNHICFKSESEFITDDWMDPQYYF